ncbi:hypothetical protein N824_08180 [Pedobacter sp. V48]|nr:hypothetical protein N824_08180 [Pedobacter sp. V48]
MQTYLLIIQTRLRTRKFRIVKLVQKECIMKTIEYFKLQAKNLHKDFKTKKHYLDPLSGDYFYEYEPKFFDVDAILISFNIDQDNFTLMNAHHIIARMVGFDKWTELLKASSEALELAKLLFDNMHKIHIEEWQDYLARNEHDNDVEFNDGAKLDIFKTVFAEVDGHESFRMDYRLAKNKKPLNVNHKIKPRKKMSTVKITALPLDGAERIEFISTANSVFEQVLQRIEPQHPHLVRQLWNAEEYIDDILLKPDMLPIDRDYALSLIDAFLVQHVIGLAVDTDDQDVYRS